MKYHSPFIIIGSRRDGAPLQNSLVLHEEIPATREVRPIDDKQVPSDSRIVDDHEELLTHPE